MEPDLSEIVPKVHLEPIVVPPCKRKNARQEKEEARLRKDLEKQFRVDLEDAARADEILSKHQTKS